MNEPGKSACKITIPSRRRYLARLPNSDPAVGCLDGHHDDGDLPAVSFTPKAQTARMMARTAAAMRTGSLSKIMLPGYQ